MIKVAILDDYQNVSQEFVDLKKLSGKYEIKVFSEPFIDERISNMIIASIFLDIYFFLFESVIPAIINIAPQIW